MFKSNWGIKRTTRKFNALFILFALTIIGAPFLLHLPPEGALLTATPICVLLAIGWFAKVKLYKRWLLARFDSLLDITVELRIAIFSMLSDENFHKNKDIISVKELCEFLLTKNATLRFTVSRVNNQIDALSRCTALGETTDSIRRMKRLPKHRSKDLEQLSQLTFIRLAEFFYSIETIKKDLMELNCSIDDLRGARFIPLRKKISKTHGLLMEFQSRFIESKTFSRHTAVSGKLLETIKSVNDLFYAHREGFNENSSKPPVGEIFLVDLKR